MYKYKGKYYRILHYLTYKERPSGDWIPCVVYQQLDSGMVFVRNTEDFKNKFLFDN